MKLLSRSIATCHFELKRSLTLQRLSVAAALSLFPPLMLGLMLSVRRAVPGSVSIVEFLIVFLVALVCLLSLLLWATPNVYTELEGKSWMFIASRPQGRIANVLGKYFASVIFSFSVCFISISLSILIAIILDALSGNLSLIDPVGLWLTLIRVFLLACLTYAAALSLIGAIFFRRAMVIGAAYVLGFEVVVSRIPALIGKLTASYHLQQLGMHWNQPLRLQIEGFTYQFNLLDQWINLLVLFSITAVSLILLCIVIINRQYVTADET